MAADGVIVCVDGKLDVAGLPRVGDAKVMAVGEGDRRVVRVEVAKGIKTAGVVFPAPGGRWDLSGVSYVMADVRNTGKHLMKVRIRVDNAGVDDQAAVKFGINPDGAFVNGDVTLLPGESGTVQVELRRRKPEWIKVDLFGMVCYPWGQCQSSDRAKSAGAVDAEAISKIQLYVRNPFEDACFEISGIRGEGAYEKPPAILAEPATFFPFIDAFGQYVHEDWAGKIHGAADLQTAREAEAADLAEHPGGEGRDAYGGWQGGPKLEATGWFYVRKYNGKWWLVDPLGHLFFSNGMDSINMREGTTTLDERAHWFAELPARDSEFGEFYGSGKAFPRGHYAGRTTTSYDFTRGNLLRKYGGEWPTIFGEMVHQRLRSWGFNTIANWGEPAIYGMRKTPYTVNVTFKSKPLEGADGWWGKSPDSFDEDFKTQLRKAMAGQAETSAKDPMCLGYFVGNEMEWGGSDLELAKMTLSSPAEQAGKKVFVGDLRAKYGAIEKLNEAWGTAHGSWEALLECTVPPEGAGAHADLAAFTGKTCENYFRTVRETVKEAAPNHLYLGCRFAGGFDPPAVMAAAAKYCDVVSVNMYRRSMAHYRMTVEADVPLLVGEYSFWARDCGKFNMGGISVEAMIDQPRRADAFKEFLQSVLRHPQFVGAHWFKYMDQATSGRGDGENFQFGFVDVADTPYRETVAAARLIGREMYPFRASGR